MPQEIRRDMKRVLFCLIMMAVGMPMVAQSIGFIDTKKAWYYIYEQSGKKIRTLITSQVWCRHCGRGAWRCWRHLYQSQWCMALHLEQRWQENQHQSCQVTLLHKNFLGCAVAHADDVDTLFASCSTSTKAIGSSCN